MILPSAAIGNSLTLATFGAGGELMGFFYPHIDFAQNVREGMFAVAVPRGGSHELIWCFDDRWRRAQALEPRSNVLTTTLDGAHPGLRVEVTDVAIPGEFAILRSIRLRQENPQPGLRFYQYLNLSLRDVDRRNAVHFWSDDNVVVQQFRRVAIGVTASRAFSVQCGGVGPGGASDVKRGMGEGRLSGSEQAMGDVDFAVGFDVPAERAWTCSLIIAGGSHRREVIEDAQRLVAVAPEVHIRAARARCDETLKTAAGSGGRIEEEFAEPYERAVLSIMDLYDQRSGTFIAAPEFDPYYSKSGGYGYCWPRDAAYSAQVVAELGLGDLATRFFDWCKSAQLRDGHWFQRYWVNGSEAPSWCVRSDEIQLDQTCALVYAVGRHARRLGAASGPFVERMRACVERATGAIVGHLGESGLHKQAADLWECCYGSFAYTNAAVIAALREAREIFDLQVPDLDVLKRTLIDTFHRPETGDWLRRIDEQARADETADSSVLGLIEPWGVLDPADPADRRLALATVRFVEERLSVPWHRFPTGECGIGRAILRFEHESYMGGGPGCVNTLWLARVMLRIGAHSEGDERADLAARARGYVRTAVAMANPVGQLPELSPNLPGIGYWAAPHAWASALLIQCVRAM